MFTGIIEKVGVLKSRGENNLVILPKTRFNSLVIGESIAVNGCCLSLEKEYSNGAVEFFTLGETLKRTNLSKLKINSNVNLERALQANSRLGGHMVAGHVDACAKVISKERNSKGDLIFRIELPEIIAPELVEKGSIAVDGISLTIVEVNKSDFTVHLIPLTQDDTSLVDRNINDFVNLESDVIAKYVRRQLSFLNEKKDSKVTMELLDKAGFL